MKPITSSENPKLKAALKLNHSRGRNQQGRFLIHGVRELKRALASRVEVAEVFLCESCIDSAELEAIEEISAQKNVPVFSLPFDLFRKIAYGDRDDGAIGVGISPDTTLESLSLPGDAFVIVVEGIEKPGNLGAVARSADGAGAAALIAANTHTSFFHPNSIRASMGTVFSLPVAEGDSEAVCKWLQQNSFAIYAAIVESNRTLWDVKLSGRAAIVLGSESTGLSNVWRENGVMPVSLPMLGIADSLNISATAAICAYEVARQRHDAKN